MKTQFHFSFIAIGLLVTISLTYDVLSRLPKEQSGLLVNAASATGTIGVLSALTALAFQIRQVKLQRSYDLTEKYRDDNFKVAERFVKYEFSNFVQENNVILTSGLSGLRDYKVEIEVPSTGDSLQLRLDIIVQRVANYYNAVGTLAAYGTIDTDIFFATAGSDLLLSWKILETVIASQDALRHSVRDDMQLKHDLIWTSIPYQGGFKYLVDRFEASRASRSAERLITYGDGLKVIEDPLGLKNLGWW